MRLKKPVNLTFSQSSKTDFWKQPALFMQSSHSHKTGGPESSNPMQGTQPLVKLPFEQVRLKRKERKKERRKKTYLPLWHTTGQTFFVYIGVICLPKLVISIYLFLQVRSFFVVFFSSFFLPSVIHSVAATWRVFGLWLHLLSLGFLPKERSLWWISKSTLYSPDSY